MPRRPTPAPPIAFSPPRLYVLKQVWDDPLAARRAERLSAAWPAAEVRTFAYADLPDIVVSEGWDRFPRMGTRLSVPPPIPILTLFRFDGEAVRSDSEKMKAAYRGSGSFPFHVAAGGGAFVFFCSGNRDLTPSKQHVCRPQWRLHQGRGCPHQCAYCSLGGYLISAVNTEAYIEKLSELLARNPWQKTWLYDDVMDVPTLEPQLDTLAPLMRFFASTRDRYLIVHTKTDRAEGMIEAGAPSNTIAVWSLAGPTQAERIEPKAGSTDGRIEAARRCQEAGMTIRYKFKPIVPVPRWREEAAETIDKALSRTQPDNLSMTVLMWMKAADLRGCIRAEDLDPEALRGAEAAAAVMDDDRNGPFPHEFRETVYRHYLAEIRKRDSEIPVTISTESLHMWQALGPALGFSPADYVCGCGAGATPGKRKLDRSPWNDARAALTWDGKPALETDTE